MSWQDFEYGPEDRYWSEDQLADEGVIWPGDISKALHDVIAERERQQAVEGWSPEHDDAHGLGIMAFAGAAYALHAAMHDCEEREAMQVKPPIEWPWEEAWWKPKDRRTDLVRAAALLVAEIERLDRAALAKAEDTP